MKHRSHCLSNNIIYYNYEIGIIILWPIKLNGRSAASLPYTCRLDLYSGQGAKKINNNFRGSIAWLVFSLAASHAPLKISIY